MIFLAQKQNGKYLEIKSLTIINKYKKKHYSNPIDFYESETGRRFDKHNLHRAKTYQLPTTVKIECGKDVHRDVTQLCGFHFETDNNRYIFIYLIDAAIQNPHQRFSVQDQIDDHYDERVAICVSNGVAEDQAHEIAFDQIVDEFGKNSKTVAKAMQGYFEGEILHT